MKYLKIIIDKNIINKQIMKKIWDHNNKYFFFNYNDSNLHYSLINSIIFLIFILVSNV